MLVSMRFSSFIALAALSAAVGLSQPASLVLRNGKIATMNSAQPIVQAVVVQGDKITALGSNADAARLLTDFFHDKARADAR